MNIFEKIQSAFCYWQVLGFKWDTKEYISSNHKNKSNAEKKAKEFEKMGYDVRIDGFILED